MYIIHVCRSRFPQSTNLGRYILLFTNVVIRYIDPKALVDVTMEELAHVIVHVLSELNFIINDCIFIINAADDETSYRYHNFYKFSHPRTALTNYFFLSFLNSVLPSTCISHQDQQVLL